MQAHGALVDPHQLVDTAVRVVVSNLFASVRGTIESWRRSNPSKVPDRSEGPELWLDYVAHLGTGGTRPIP